MTLDPAPLHSEFADAPDGGAAHWVRTEDGVRIRIAHWTDTGAKGTVFLFPGRTEYIEKYGRAVGQLKTRGYSTLVIDWRGQGLADRLADDVMLGHVGQMSDYQYDVNAALEAAEALDLPKPWFLLAHSMGGCIGLRALHEGLPVKAVAFSAPMWGLMIAPAKRPVAWGMSWIGHKTRLGTNYVMDTSDKTYLLDSAFEGNSLTNDADMWRYMLAQARDCGALTLGGPSLHWLHEALLEIGALARMPSPDLPCVTFLGDEEQIVNPPDIRKRMAQWPNGTLVELDGAQHEVLMERPQTRNRAFDEACALFDAQL